MAYSLVANTWDGDSSTALTSAIDTTGATLLVVAITRFQGDAPNPENLSDSKGNTWHRLTSIRGSTSAVCLFYAESPTVGSGHTFTFTDASFGSLTVAAFSGALLTSPFDQENGAAATQPGSITPGEDNELVVTSFSSFDGSAPGTPSGYTTTDSTPNVPSVNLAGGIAYQIQTTATATNPNSWATATVSTVASFKAAAGVAGQPAVKRMGGVRFGPGFAQHVQGVRGW